MRRWITVLAVLAAVWFSLPVHAQSGVALNTVGVDIWPEYDQSAVLVIYHISMSDSTILPLTFNLRIPAQAQVYAVANSDPVNGLTNAPYERSVVGSWATLAITVNSKNVQVEYYDALIKNGTSRHVVFEWAGDYAVDAFSVDFQQPVGATGLVTQPILAQSQVGQDGLTYFNSAPQQLATGQTFALTADYQKQTDALSTSGLPVQPTQPLNSNTPGRVTMSGVLPYILAVVGVLLIGFGVVGGYYMWKKGTRRSQVARKRHIQTQGPGDTEEIYCHQCGKRAQPGDVFCRTCGMRLQKDD